MDVAVEQYADWARLAAEALDGYDALYVHIKGPDVPAHDGRAEDKRDVIAAIDAGFFSEVLRGDRPFVARSWPSRPTTRHRACARPIRPIPSHWSSAAAACSPTGPRRSASGRAPTAPSASSTGWRSCPASPR